MPPECLIAPTEQHPAERADLNHPDSLLLDLVLQGDEDAMARLYDAHSRIVYTVALRVLHDPSAAEDVLQDVFLRIWRRPASFVAARGSLRTWLGAIARNRAIDVLRRRRPTDSVNELPLAAPGNLSVEVERAVMMARIEPMIAKLPVVQQKVLKLAFFQGWSHAEIAKSTHIPLGTIKTRIRCALQTLGKAVRKPDNLDVSGAAGRTGFFRPGNLRDQSTR